LCALLLIVAEVVTTLHTSHVTGRSVPRESTIVLQAADALPLPITFQLLNNEAGDRTNDLMALVRSFNLPHGTENRLITRLQTALAAIGMSDTETACSSLTALINQCQAQTGQKLNAQQAAQLITAATQIKTALVRNAMCQGAADVSMVSTTARDCRRQPDAPVNLARCI